MKEKMYFSEMYEGIFAKNPITDLYYRHAVNELGGKYGDGKLEDLAKAYAFCDMERQSYKIIKPS